VDTAIYKGFEIHFQTDKRMVNLTNLWRAEGSNRSKQPIQFLRNNHTKELIDVVAKSQSCDIAALVWVVRGRYGGTFAHWKIALAYAKYLSPKFHAWANEAIKVGTLRCVDRYRSGSRNRPIPSWGSPGPGIEPRLSGVSGAGVSNGLPFGVRASTCRRLSFRRHTTDD
jgi:hypothetical protein